MNEQEILALVSVIAEQRLEILGLRNQNTLLQQQLEKAMGALIKEVHPDD